MVIYITVSDVDDLLGETWTDADKKAKAVLMANVWLTTQDLQNIDLSNIPDEVKLAGSYAASVAAAGRLYQQKMDSGVITSKSVEADDVKVSKLFVELSVNSAELLDADLQLALALLKPWMCSPFQTFLIRA